MPRQPKRPCSYPGCPNLTDARFCEEHAKVEAKRYERNERDPATKRRCGRAWKRIRDSYAAAHPLCEVCLEKGCTRQPRRYITSSLYPKAEHTTERT